ECDQLFLRRLFALRYCAHGEALLAPNFPLFPKALPTRHHHLALQGESKALLWRLKDLGGPVVPIAHGTLLAHAYAASGWHISAQKYLYLQKAEAHGHAAQQIFEYPQSPQ